MADYELDVYIDDFQFTDMDIGDSNLDFELGDMTGWRIEDATASATGDAAYSGDYGCKLEVTAGSYGILLRPCIDVTDRYIVSFWLKLVECTDPSITGVYISAYIEDADLNYVEWDDYYSCDDLPVEWINPILDTSELTGICRLTIQITPDVFEVPE